MLLAEGSDNNLVFALEGWDRAWFNIYGTLRTRRGNSGDMEFEADYNPANDLLDEQFMLKGRWFHRKDLEVTNSKGNVLRCSHYLPLEVPKEGSSLCYILSWKQG
ncbi:hypothetical protein HPP92_011726 [Vanilla planifolia]|uniref:Uncharacterized protein n=1 Tax=Vanilla planifolia TaxID=51239 RepID=A0A835RCX2_VANPL|nr:hypothetical protein HPP92_011726 [Vanilla planifolia]